MAVKDGSGGGLRDGVVIGITGEMVKEEGREGFTTFKPPRRRVGRRASRSAGAMSVADWVSDHLQETGDDKELVKTSQLFAVYCLCAEMSEQHRVGPQQFIADLREKTMQTCRLQGEGGTYRFEEFPQVVRRPMGNVLKGYRIHPRTVEDMKMMARQGNAWAIKGGFDALPGA